MDDHDISPAPEITIRGLDKSFGSHRVLRDLDLTIRPGDFLGLMGPNGAGKSTLLKILDGLHPASKGEIRVAGERVSSLAGRRDVAFIHQDLGLVDALTICDNLRLGQERLRLLGPILSGRREREAAERALARVGLDRPVETPLARLSAGEKALVAIARALDKGASVLFVDEATSTLPPAEANKVVAALRRSAAAGAAVVMVTHKLHEILEAGSRIVVLLDGELAVDQPRSEMDREALVRRLARHEAEGAPVAPAPEHGEVVITLAGACGTDVGPVDLQLRRHQVLGLTGLPGSGLHDVAALVAGRERLRSGRREHARGLRVGYIPPYRETQGGLTGLTVRENVTVSSIGRWVRKGTGLLDPGLEARRARAMVTDLNVQPPDPEGRYDALSGGNKQKALFGRILLTEPDLIVLCEPTRGVDVGTRQELYQIIRGARDRGAAVLVATSDAEDLFALCDGIAIVGEGRPGQAHRADELDPSELEVLI